MLLASILLASLGLIYISWNRIRRLLTPKGIPDIPAYPDPTPIWGDIHRFQTSIKEHGGFSRCFDDIAKDLGVMSQLRLGFFKTFIVLADLPTIEHVLVKQHDTVVRARQTTDIFAGLVPTGQISLPTGDMWKHHRRIVGPAMTSKYLGLATPLANEAVMDMVQYLKAKIIAADGRAWSIEKDFEAGTMDAICSMAFGASWGTCKSYERQVKSTPPQVGPLDEATFTLHPTELHYSMIYLFNSVDNYSAWPWLSNLITSLKPTYRMHAAKLNSYLRDKTHQARKWAESVGADVAVETATNTLDMMVARELRGEDWLAENEMRDELYLYLIAGTETSATTLTWWAKYMTNHPEVQRKLRQHVLEHLPEIQDRPPTFEDLTKLPYLEAVVHETLRLSRTAGGYARETDTDVVILGKRIPKGTTIVIPTVTGWEDEANPIYTIPSRSDLHDAPSHSEALASDRANGAVRKVGYWEPGTGKLFQPERWLDAKGQFDPNAGPSLPFSLGQRACFGKNLALLELRLFVLQLNQAFFFTPVAEGQNSFEKYETITTHPRQSFVRPIVWPE